MVAIGDVNASPAAQAALIPVIEKLQAVQIVQVPDDGRILAVDFECVECFMTAGIAGGLKGGQRAVAEARQEEAGVVDADGFHLSGS